MNDHKHLKVWRAGVGPGGTKCPCCNPFYKGGSQKATKQFFNRKVRRKFKNAQEVLYQDVTYLGDSFFEVKEK